MKKTEELFNAAIDQSNFRAIFENQREKLIEILKADLIYPYNGGYFILGPSLFYEISMHAEYDKVSATLLDINYNPIEVSDLDDFLFNTKAQYFEAIKTYKIGLDYLKKSRMVRTLTKLHDMDDDVEE